jgi:uncharacterized protein YjbI with pentapeptide repeats
MANDEHLAVLRCGVQEWNAWRRRHSEVVIDLVDGRLNGLRLRGADLNHANLRGAHMSRAYLRFADLRDADLSHATLDDANLRDAKMHDANLMGAQLVQANLLNAGLFDANLTGATLVRANLRDANLSGTNLVEANLTLANLASASLRNANLKGAVLESANLSQADMTGADLTNVLLRNTVFGNVDLRQVVGLERCYHVGPSILGVETVVRSGPLPLKFLRGCGVPERLIDYLPSLIGASPIQFYSCFISYSTQNQDFADRLHADLQDHGVRCWFAPHDMKAGRKVHEQIDEAIRVYDRLLLILSDESMASPWVKTEIAKARAKENSQRRRVLFPVRLVPFENVRAWEQFDADVGGDTAKEIREYYLPDFSGWKTLDIYQPAFQKLLAALQSEEVAGGLTR